MRTGKAQHHTGLVDSPFARHAGWLPGHAVPVDPVYMGLNNRLDSVAAMLVNITVVGLRC